MLCSTLNLGCEITTNSKQLIGTAKWEDILKLHETEKQCALSPGAQCDAQTSEHRLMDYYESELGCTSYE